MPTKKKKKKSAEHQGFPGRNFFSYGSSYAKICHTCSWCPKYSLLFWPVKGEAISLNPFYHLHPLHRHLDISLAITAENSALHIAHRVLGSLAILHGNTTKPFGFVLISGNLSAFWWFQGVLKIILTENWLITIYSTLKLTERLYALVYIVWLKWARFIVRWAHLHFCHS